METATEENLQEGRMYKIGEFSRLTEIPVKTLRFYHEIQLLEPVEIDGETGYRYYDGNSYERARTIRLLKACHFTLAEIREAVDQIRDDDDLRAFIREKYEQMDGRVAEIRREQEKLLRLIDRKERMKMAKTSAVSIKEVAPQKVASIRYKGRYEDMGQYIGRLFGVVKGSAAGPVIALYYDEGYMEEGADIEVCVPVKKEVSGKDVVTRTLEGGRFMSAIHTGPYDQLSESYKVLMDAMQSQGLQTETPSREVYLKGPGMLLKGNPEKYETEILMKVL